MSNTELLDRILLAEIAKAENEQAEANQNINTLESTIAICQMQLEQNAELLKTKEAEIKELEKLRSELIEPDNKDEKAKK